MSKFVKVLLLTCVTVVVPQLAVGQRPKQVTQKAAIAVQQCDVEYDRLIDTVFPHFFLGQGNGFGLAIRASPYDEPEVQLNVMRSEPGKYEAVLYRAKGKSLVLQLQDLCDGSRALDYSTAEVRIKFEKVRLELKDSDVVALRDEFLKVAAKSIESENSVSDEKGSNGLMFDHRTTYQVWYSHGFWIHMLGNEEFAGTDPAASEARFVRWARGVIEQYQKMVLPRPKVSR